MKKNKYKLNVDADIAARHIVAEVALTYDIDTDKLKSIVAIRNDVENPEFQLRIGQALENAVRTVMPPYKEEMELLERLAKSAADRDDRICAENI